MAYRVPDLRYPYEALGPYIDEATVSAARAPRFATTRAGRTTAACSGAA